MHDHVLKFLMKNQSGGWILERSWEIKLGSSVKMMSW